ncbi:M12 family metallo-peptidase [Nocardioides solisilvae]|uniref:M12 family metallo-peptidase n=1 Tax=Nocardioides solisilvae TaxID=1542435 RepID=UPI000D74DF98|nr:M12 family metallo-peptidase [Nocardioides solisilvae]
MNVRHTVASATLVVLAAAATPALSGIGPAGAAGTGDAAGGERLLHAPGAARGGDLAPVPPGAQRHRLVTLDEELLAEQGPGDRLRVDLFDGDAVTVVLDGRAEDGATTSWSGRPEAGPGSFTAVQVDGTQHLRLSTPAGIFEVTEVGAGTHRLVQASDPSERDGDDTHVPDVPAARPGGTGGTGGRPEAPGAPLPEAAGGDPVSEIDIAFLYPRSLVDRFGAGPLQAQFALGIAETNQTLANSGLTARVRMVGSRQVAAETPGDTLTLIRQLDKAGDGVFDEAFALREETHADLVSLWLSGDPAIDNVCGRGSLGGLSPYWDPELAPWTVIRAECEDVAYVFAHEIGHNLSAQHDAGAASAPLDGKPYARGYVDLPARTMTVMAYWTQCYAAGVECTHVPHFSSPSVTTAGGRLTGTPEADNARAVAEQAPAVANYRQSRIHPGTVTVTGAGQAGTTLSASAAGWAPEKLSFGYQWQVDGAAVPGATGQTFTPDATLVGRSVSVLATASGPWYQPVSLASAPVVVTAAPTPPVVTPPVDGRAHFSSTRTRLSGKARPGGRLRARVGGWSPTPAATSYTWLRNGRRIKGAAGATYRVRAKDRGKTIRVVVTGSRSGYHLARGASRAVRVKRR